MVTSLYVIRFDLGVAMTDIIISIIRKNIENPNLEIDLNKNFMENEIDSLLLIKIIVDIEEALNIEFQEDDLIMNQYDSIQDFIRVAERIGKGE